MREVDKSGLEVCSWSVMIISDKYNRYRRLALLVLAHGQVEKRAVCRRPGLRKSVLACRRPMYDH